MTRRPLTGSQAAAGAASMISLILGLFFLSGCSQVAGATTSPGSQTEQAANVKKNSVTGIATITLSEKAIVRLGLKTVTVQAWTGGAGITLPYDAIIYDSLGKTWVYTNPEARVYQRQAVTVTRVEAGTVIAAEGPPPGTVIVTTAAAELFGAEFDTAH